MLWTKTKKHFFEKITFLKSNITLKMKKYKKVIFLKNNESLVKIRVKPQFTKKAKKVKNKKVNKVSKNKKWFFDKKPIK